jgi:protein-S-isoprenylcysteine O-methyltransferase Ste14
MERFRNLKLENSMGAPNHFAEPLFELKGVAAKIDLSAWISGVSYSLGLVLVIQDRVNVWPEQSPAISFSLVMVMVVFFIAAMMVQRHMRISLLASNFGSPLRLVTSGLFQLSRNPIYVAFLVPLASLALLSLSAAVLATAFYVTAMNLTVLRKEERDLSQAFGQTYADYAAKVPRWIL